MIGKVIKVDEVMLLGLNGLFVRVLMEVDIRFPLPKVLVLNDKDNLAMRNSLKCAYTAAE